MNRTESFYAAEQRDANLFNQSKKCSIINEFTPWQHKLRLPQIKSRPRNTSYLLKLMRTSLPIIMAYLKLNQSRIHLTGPAIMKELLNHHKNQC